MLTCNIIGAGRLGKNIALALTTNNRVTVQAICNRTVASSTQAWQELGLNGISCTLEQLPPADITLICCSDDAISVIAQQLAEMAIQPGSYVIHCSGVLNSSVLQPLKKHQCAVASLHPLKSFKAGYLEPDAFAQVHVVIEGDEQVCSWLETSLLQLNALVHAIQPTTKAKYHAAAAIACNYLVTLAAVSEELMAATGLEQGLIKSMIAHLMGGTLNNIQHNSNTAAALTGPLMRGDIGTLELHLQAIDNPVSRELYKAAGLATLPLTKLAEIKKQQISALFADN